MRSVCNHSYIRLLRSFDFIMTNAGKSIFLQFMKDNPSLSVPQAFELLSEQESTFSASLASCKRWAAEEGLGKHSVSKELKTAFVEYMARNTVSVNEGMEQMKRDFPGRPILKNTCYRWLQEAGIAPRREVEKSKMQKVAAEHPLSFQCMFSFSLVFLLPICLIFMSL